MEFHHNYFLSSCELGDLERVQDFLEEGYDVNYVDPVRGTSPLLLACENGKITVVQELLNRGADINITGMYGSTPLMEACYDGKDNYKLETRQPR